MNIDKIIASIPGMSHQERERVQANAARLAESGSAEQKQAAERVLVTLAETSEGEHQALVDRLKGMEVSARVVEAFRVKPMSETEAKIIQVLLDNPGSTSTELSQALGWGAQTWHLHFGTMCANRAVYLWPVPKSEARTADFYSGILADLSSDNRWTIKPEVETALSELGLRASSQC